MVQKLSSTPWKMVMFVNKPVYVFVFFSVLFAISEGEFSHSEWKCLKKTGKFPIPGSCSSFYTCANWKVLREESCPFDQNFNPIKGWCDYKDLYPCLEKPRRKECPSANGRFLKNGTDCEIYFDCCNGEPTEKKCPEEQLFDAKSQKCDWDELVECDGSSRNKDCPEKNGKFLKPGTKCRIYIECSKGKAKEKQCPKYQLFNIKSGICDWKERVPCEDGSKNNDCPKPNGKFLKAGTKCRNYFECYNGKAKEKQCPKYQLFNTKSGICDKKERVSCEEEKKNDCPKPTGRFLKSGTECKVYLDCYKGKATEKQCPKNQLFDSRTGKCDWEELVSCKDSETSSESSSSESSESDESSKESTLVSEIISPSTSPNTISEEFSTGTTHEIKSSLSTTDSKTDETESPLPTSDSTTEEVESPQPSTQSTNKEDSTTEDVESPQPTQSTSEEDSTPYKITSEATLDPTKSTPLVSQSTSPETTSDSRTSAISSTPQITAGSTPFWTTEEPSTREFFSSTTQLRESTPGQTTDGLSTQEITTSPEITEPTTRPTVDELTSGLSTIQDLTSTTAEEEVISSEPTTEEEVTSSEPTTEEEVISSEPTTESILEPITRETTVEEISSSYQTEQSSSHDTKETTTEEIFTESEQTSSSFRTAQPSTNVITEITSKIVDIISSDLTTEITSSLETKSEIVSSSTSVYQSTLDPVLVEFVCPEKTGYYPHPTNKHKYIGCVHGNAYIMDCPSNLVYNVKKKQCLYDY